MNMKNTLKKIVQNEYVHIPLFVLVTVPTILGIGTRYQSMPPESMYLSKQECARWVDNIGTHNQYVSLEQGLAISGLAMAAMAHYKYARKKHESPDSTLI